MMKTGSLLSLLVLSSLTVHAAPSPALNAADNAQAVFSQNPFNDQLGSRAPLWIDETKQAILRGKNNLEKWIYKQRQYIKQDNLLCVFVIVAIVLCGLTNIVDEFVTHPNFTGYDLRLTEPTLCDSSVKQYSGYLDVASDKHLFFW